MLFRPRVSAAALLLIVGSTAAAQTASSEIELFETKIRPVLARNCYACHSSQSPVPQGGLSLDNTSGIRKGGNSGPAIVPGSPETSLLIKAVRQTDAKLKMPPGNKPL